MCGIVGMVNLKHDINNDNFRNVLRNMSEKINKRGPDEDGCFYSSHCLMDHKRLIVIDPEGRKTTYEYKTSR